MSSSRTDGRAPEAMRPIRFERGFTNTAPGSVLASFGETRVLCTATYTDGVPSFLQGNLEMWRCLRQAALAARSAKKGEHGFWQCALWDGMNCVG